MSSRRPAIRRIALLISMAVIVASSSAVQADTLFGGPDPANAAPNFAPDFSSSRAARQELALARLLLARARAAATELQRVAETELREAGGYRALQFTAVRAANDYQAARRPVLAALSRDEEYARLSRQREALRAEIRSVTDVKNYQPEKIEPLARKALVTGERLSRSESLMFALDPAVEETRNTMTDAFDVLRRLAITSKHRASEFPIVVSAREDMATARERVRIANQNLIAALRAEMAADRRSTRSRRT